MRKQESILGIIEFYNKTNRFNLEKTIDLFADSVENYKKAKTRPQKLKFVALSFINACRVASVETLTGAQCFEVFNNLATDFNATKPTVERAINKIMRKEREAYENNNSDKC